MSSLFACAAIEAVAPVVEIAAGVDHVLVEPQPIEGVGDVVVVGDVLLVFRLAAVAFAILGDPLERPWPAARREQERQRDPQRGGREQALAQFAAARLRPPAARSNSVPLTMSSRSRRPQIGERRQARRAHKSGDRAFVGDGDRQRVGRPVGRDARAVPQPKTEFEAEAAMRVGEQRREPRQPFFRLVHIVSVAATREDRISARPTVRRDAARTASAPAQRDQG